MPSSKTILFVVAVLGVVLALGSGALPLSTLPSGVLYIAFHEAGGSYFAGKVKVGDTWYTYTSPVEIPFPVPDPVEICAPETFTLNSKTLVFKYWLAAALPNQPTYPWSDMMWSIKTMGDHVIAVYSIQTEAATTTITTATTIEKTITVSDTAPPRFDIQPSWILAVFVISLMAAVVATARRK
ncbi:MAG: hypothetical protein QXR91_08365 [Nitrososphaerales archaeon]